MPVTVESGVSGPFIPNGSATDFAFDFKADSATEVIVVDEDGTPLSPALYSVELSSDEGGKAVFSVAPEFTDYQTLFIISSPAMTQESDFGNSGPSFNPAAITRAFDRAAIRDLSLQAQIDRTIRVPFGDSGTTMPADRAGKYLSFDVGGNPVASAGTGSDAAFRTDAAADGGSALIGFSHSATNPEGSVGDHLRRFIFVTDAPYRVKINNTSPTVMTANTAAMNQIFADCAAAGGGTIGLPNGQLWTDGAMAWASNVKLWGMGGSVIRVKNGYNSYTFTGNLLTNIEMMGVTIEGNGQSGNSMVYFTNCIGVTAEKNKITKAGGIALQFVGCGGVTTRGNTCNNNFYYGIEFRDCVIAKSYGDTCNFNGDTGVASNTGGRGIMIWRCHDWLVTGATLNGNTEYGFRNYSEAADSVASYDGTFSDSILEDNVRTDVVMYDEGAPGLVTRIKVRNVKVTRTTVPTLGQSFLCHGKKIDYEDCSVYQDGAMATYTAFNFFNASDNTLKNCRSRNVSVPISGNASVSDIRVSKFHADGCVNALTIPTVGWVVEDSTFIHGGAGATDTAINNTATATGKNYYHNNKFVGFNIHIRIGDEAVSLRFNETSGGAVGLQKDGSTLANLEHVGNNWHSANRNHLYNLEKYATGIARSSDAALPTGDSYPLLSEFLLTGVASGQPYRYLKTGAAVGNWTAIANMP